ncbi:MAG TPA: type II toxin-antitoxin system VapC family toxin [Thermoanaerobaculia bacterium]|nr:type II toxin-antitoxin system VapC family toxin [Thermoanaerobaculia bacterium]
MIVADKDLVAYLLIDGEKTALARAVWTADPLWMMPTLWRSEFLNVLTTSVRAKVLTLAEAHDTWNVAQTVFAHSEVEPSGDAVLQTAAARNLSAYDAQFVVAAADLEVRLITSDRRLLHACPDIAISPETFTT